ncbi:MAG: HYR domain-containing protein [Verrucomicrobiales bacterium]|nr:HYR domain-containing protein [Verrucomicrobiales bacterium]
MNSPNPMPPGRRCRATVLGWPRQCLAALGFALFLQAFTANGQVIQRFAISDIADRTVAQGTNTGPIPFSVTGTDTPQSGIRVSATSSDTRLVTANGLAIAPVRAGGWQLTVTPTPTLSGQTTITVSATDGQRSDTETFVLTVTAVTVNTAPRISDIPNQVIPQEGTSGPIPFRIDDAETSAGQLTLRVSSDNSALISSTAIAISGSGADRTIALTPTAGQSGVAIIKVTVSDGQATSSDDFTVTVNPYDFGDAPDQPYPTLRSNSGAAQRIQKGFSLGTAIDAEANGQPNTTATGDGADEDGVSFPSGFTPGQTATVVINLVTTTGFGGRIDGWFDFDANGKFDEPAEHLVDGSLLSGNNTFTFAVPSGAKAGTTFARFRLSQEGGVDAFGPSNEAGEVEDYQIEVKSGGGLDFGDAPDPTYPTTLKNNGARHPVNPDVFLGQRIDAEQDGQPNAGATGDDLNPTNADDEDGVVFPSALIVGQSATVAVRASTQGFLSAWIDFNADGDWADAGEAIFENTGVVGGTNTLTFLVPSATKAGSTFSRFRFSRTKIEGFIGAAVDGEVEDHVVRIEAPQESFDFGDAPDPTYPTTLKNNGARHRIVQGVFLGAVVDPETDGQPNAGATGDDAVPAAVDDEDGVEFPSQAVAGQSNPVLVRASTEGFLSAWIDFNADGDWADAGEAIFENITVVGGTNTLSFVAPATSKTGPTFTRFRFSRTKIEGFVGPSADGEVEDHPLRVSTPQSTLDFGDAPDPTYPTTLKNNGARHRINPDVFLGVRVDAEPDGQPNAGASGDDGSPTNGLDDEDGVLFDLPLAGGQNGKVQVTASTQGRLWAWVDFNADGDWVDAGERIFNGLVIVGGVNNLTFPVPAEVKAGPSFSRFRFTRTTIESYTGEAADGEVEDHPVRLSAPEVNYDFGDAPEETTSYPTTLARNGARHQLEQGFRLGEAEDVESDGQPNPAATGDDINPAAGPDDEDGVRFLTAITAGSVARIEVTTTARGRLDAWVDFNANGSWNDAGEKIFNAEQLGAGLNTLSFNVPASIRGGVSFARFRFSQQGGLAPEGFGGAGEVEDYPVRIDRTAPCELGCTGVDFWLTFPGNYAPDPANPVKPQLCIIGPPGTQVSIRIAALTYNNAVVIPAAGSINVNLPKDADLGDSNDLIEDKGVHVTATQPVTVHALSQVKYTSDGFTALSTEVLGNQYIVLGYGNVHSGVPELNGTQFALVATEDDTKVVIVPSEVTGTHDSGFPYLINLKAGQTYQLRNTNDAPRDLTGTLILSDKPIAAFGGHQVANVRSQNSFFADYLVEQMLPVNRWGTEFFARPLAIPGAPGTRSNYTIRVLASQNNTRVWINGVLITTLNLGEYVDRTLAGAAQIITDRPAQMAQYAASSDVDGVVNADPFMVLGQQRNLFNRDLRFCTASGGFLTHHINVIVPTAAVGTVQLDGAAFPGGFAAIGASGYSHGTAQVAAGVHRVTAAQPAGVIVYGWNEYESYAWPACQFFGDTTPPELTCPQEQITLVAGPFQSPAGVTPCVAAVPELRSQVKATDNCGFASTAAPVVTQDPPAGTLVRVGTHDITLSVADAQGNVGTCVVKLVVTDPNPEGPVTLVCPTNLVVACASSDGAIVNYEAIALKGCTPVPLQCNPPPGSLFPVGTTTVTCVLEDEDNSLSCTFNVTVRCGGRRIEVAITGDLPTLSWGDGGRLETAESLSGPWTVVEDAKPPYRIQARGNRGFFRIRED